MLLWLKRRIIQQGSVARRAGLVFLLVVAITGLAPLKAQQLLERKDTAEVRYVNTRKFYIYKVEKGETLYSLCRKFGVTREELLEFNPDLKDGLKNKMKLWIPAAAPAAVAVEPVVKAPQPKPSRLHLALLLPLMLENGAAVETLPPDSVPGEDRLDRDAAAMLEYYEGMLYASGICAREEGLELDLQVCDTRGDSAHTAQLLRSNDFRKPDVMVVAGDNAVLNAVNRYSVAGRIPLFSASLNSTGNFSGNPDAVSLTPSSLTQCRRMGEACRKLFPGAACTVLRTASWRENERSKAFNEGWTGSEGPAARTLSLPKDPKDPKAILHDSLSSGNRHLLFVPSSDEDLVSSMVTALKDTVDTARIVLVGIPTWQYFETIDPSVLEALHTHIFSSSLIRYDSASAIGIRKHFRDTYFIEPSDYAYQGFDNMMLISTLWSSHPLDLLAGLPGTDGSRIKGVYSQYAFFSSGVMHENGFIYVLRYHDTDLEVVLEVTGP
jgi:LysM repeat protein